MPPGGWLTQQEIDDPEMGDNSIGKTLFKDALLNLRIQADREGKLPPLAERKCSYDPEGRCPGPGVLNKSAACSTACHYCALERDEHLRMRPEENELVPKAPLDLHAAAGHAVVKLHNIRKPSRSSPFASQPTQGGGGCHPEGIKPEGIKPEGIKSDQPGMEHPEIGSPLRVWSTRFARCYTRRYGRVPRTATRLTGSRQPATRNAADCPTPGRSAVPGLGRATSRCSLSVSAATALRPSAIRPAAAEAPRLALGARGMRAVPRLRRARRRLHGRRLP